MPENIPKEGVDDIKHSTPQTMMTSVNDNSRNGHHFAEMLDEYDYLRPKRGQFLEGEVLKIADDAMFFDVGAKRDAIVPHTDLELLDDDLLEEISRGDHFPLYVIRTPQGDEELLVSLRKGLEKQNWDQAEQLLESQETLELKVVGYNKGGVLVQYERLHAFVPNSHVPSLQRIFDRNALQERKTDMIGGTLVVKVLEVELDRKRLIMSAKAAEKEEHRKRLLELKIGEVQTGRVVNLVPYGAFVDLDGVNGLLHISRLAWQHVDHPSDVLSVGDEIEVLIDDVDVERERISLNRKALLPSPWDTFEEQHEVGELIAGEITSIAKFGLFVRVEPNIEGLIHQSEINLTGVGDLEEIFLPGEQVLARILNIDPDQERLGLSLRRISPTEEIAWMSEQRQEEAEA
jgi:small subunit ribosomal protein S1